jgi:cell division protease FtsH
MPASEISVRGSGAAGVATSIELEPMENPPQAAVKTDSEPIPDKPGERWPAHSSAPPWLWVLLVGGFSLIFWQFMPSAEVAVDYSPWFLDQVESNNIKSLSVRAREVRGELRQERRCRRGQSADSVLVHRFITYFPGETSIDSVITKLRQANKVTDPVWIETVPTSSAPGMIWVLLILQTVLIVILLFRVDSLHSKLPR